MARSLAGLKNKTHPFSVEVDVGTEEEPDVYTITGTYRVHAYNEALESEVVQFAEQSRGGAVIRATALRVIASWDLPLDDDTPEPVPLTPEGLREVPSEFLERLLDAIKENRSPNPATANAS